MYNIKSLSPVDIFAAEPLFERSSSHTISRQGLHLLSLRHRLMYGYREADTMMSRQIQEGFVRMELSHLNVRAYL